MDRLRYSRGRRRVLILPAPAVETACAALSNGEGQSDSRRTTFIRSGPSAGITWLFAAKEVGEDKMDLMVYNGVGAPKIVAENISMLPVPGE